MPGKIFINYRRDDVPGDARSIRDALSKEFGKPSAFMDIDNLRPGQRFEEELGNALDQCAVLIAVVGPRWMELLHARMQSGERDYVRQEIATALSRKIPLIPVRVGRENNMPLLPKADELPEDIRGLFQHQKFDVAHERFGRDVGDLLAAVRKLRGGGAKATWAWAGIGAAALALVAALPLLFSGTTVPDAVPQPVQETAAVQKPDEAELARQQQERQAAKENADRVAALEQRLAALAAEDERKKKEADDLKRKHDEEVAATDAALRPAQPGRQITFGPNSVLVLLADGSWVEYQSDKVAAKFRSLTDSAKELVLFDVSRDMYLRLSYGDMRVYFRRGKSEAWTRFVQINKVVDGRKG